MCKDPPHPHSMLYFLNLQPLPSNSHILASSFRPYNLILFSYTWALSVTTSYWECHIPSVPLVLVLQVSQGLSKPAWRGSSVIRPQFPYLIWSPLDSRQKGMCQGGWARQYLSLGLSIFICTMETVDLNQRFSCSDFLSQHFNFCLLPNRRN